MKVDANSAEELKAASEILDSLENGDFYQKEEAARKWLKNKSIQSRQLIEWTISR